MLFDVPWLSNLPLFYWGDLDLDGFDILASLRHRFPQTRSLFMDVETLEKHHSIATSVVSRGSPEAREPAELTALELAAYRVCKSQNLRLEQEHIPQAMVNQRLFELDRE